MPELPPLIPGDSNLPEHDDLSVGAATVIQRVRAQIGSLNDNITQGEPHFQEHVPSFDDDRWTVLLWNAIGKVNIKEQPKTAYDISSYPYTDAVGGYAVYLGLLVEAIKHFIITYTEEPDTQGLGSAPYLSRRDYWTRWQTTLSLIEGDFEDAVSAFKIGMIGFGSAAILIGGRQVPYGYTPKVRPSARYSWGWY
jgi:hypothetical protein